MTIDKIKNYLKLREQELRSTLETGGLVDRMEAHDPHIRFEVSAKLEEIEMAIAYVEIQTDDTCSFDRTGVEL